ncbi:hypothetical protein FSARC_13403 [Fusarium sarcochroum]|uniref:Uncharacterized protein n=1 Tax=Fusarium sarcochroum TaxID=1208366 RepID=A0A8H4WTW0_9HYPO|nr:hypothetical protein FSARC_13403 [Fusarium sarcochroum]
MPQAIITRLPLEILEAICAQLCAHCKIREAEKNALKYCPQPPSVYLIDPDHDTMSFVNLAKTCRGLYPHAIQFAYHDLETEYWPLSKVVEFLKSLHSSPNLGKLVRCLNIEFHKYPQGSGWLFIQEQMKRLGMYEEWPLLAYWKPLLTKIARDLDEHGNINMWDMENMEKDDSVKRLKRSELPWQPEQILVDVFVNMLPNIERLEFDVTPGAVHGLFISVSAKLESLRHLRIRKFNNTYEDERGPYDLFGLKNLLEKAANLESLEIDFSQNTRFLSVRPLYLKNLRSLKIQDACFNLADLENLTKQCTRLEVFTYIYDCTAWPEASGKDFKLNRLPQTLTSCRDTLQHVGIHWSPNTDDETRDDYNDHIGSFKDFPNLKTIVLGGQSLLLADVTKETPLETSLVSLLPASIEAVTLEGQHLHLYEPTLALAKEAKEGFFPHLKTFRQSRIDPDESSDSVQSLKEAMEESGISLETSPDTILRWIEIEW